MALLRGERSRAAFAKLIGVSPLTVYRWELPSDAAEARRPRGRILERLRRLAAQEVVRTTANPALTSTEQLVILPVLAHVFEATWRRSEVELLSLLASGSIRSRAGRALIGAHLAIVQAIGRSDSRAAFSTLAPILEDLRDSNLAPTIAATVHLAAALTFSGPIGELFDPGKVAAHAARVAELGPGPEHTDHRFLAWSAQLAAAFSTNDQEQVTRLLGRAPELSAGVTSGIARLKADLIAAMQALFQGAPALAVQRLEAVVERATPWPAMKVSALALLALRALDELGDPAVVLTRADQVRGILADTRVMPDLFVTHAARAEGEARVRLGAFREADIAFRAGDAAAREMRFPAIVLAGYRGRMLLLCGDSDGLQHLAEELRAIESPFLQLQARAHASHQEARAALARGDAAVAVERFAAAAAQAREHGWVFLVREILTEVVAAHLLADDPDEALAASRRAAGLLERFPSPILTAMLRLQEGVALSRKGRTADALALIEAAQATFTLGGDRPGMLLASRCRAQLSGGDPTPYDEELRALGVQCLWLAGPSRPRGDVVPVVAWQARPLLVATQRLTVPGISPSLICRELVSVVNELLPRRRIRLDEVDSTGGATLIGGDDKVPVETLEFADRCGRRYRLGIDEPITADQRAMLSAIVSVAGIALEVATLRGLSTPAVSSSPRNDSVPDLPGVIATSPGMRKLLVEVGQLSRSRATVIITGESGSGKEVIARAIHDLSTRASRPYIAFNCAAVPRELFEGQLFGYRKGAFTGAVSDHPGVIRAAHGGTLFLDEIAELPLEAQAKLLRFLENAEILPVGAATPVQVDVRIVAATHRDLAALVREQRFREDLFYRLQVVLLRVPPLRERRDDIPSLARHFVQRASSADIEPPVLSNDAIAALLAHDWPGNVRELRNVIERTMAFAPLPPVLMASHLRLRG